MSKKKPEESGQQEPDAVITNNPETDHYQIEYVSDFVDKWDDLIDWKARAAGEQEFFIKELQKRGKEKILDVATGTGYHSINLIEHGFEVTSADGNPNMLVKSFNNARERDIILRTVQADWRWLNKDIHDKYDAIICLGNSFTHLFSEKDRRKSLAEFYSALKHDGILLIDQRNYDAILDHGFSYKHTYYYAGENIKAEPEHVDDKLMRFCYKFPDDSKYRLNFYPLRKQYMRSLLKEVGFQKVKSFGDFKETFTEDDPDFFIHIAEKSYNPEEEEEENSEN
ncbi:MAG: class I SAM-dependent methyltransferase [Flavobacteriales bacterium]